MQNFCIKKPITYPADCRKIAAEKISMIGIESIEYIEKKKIFVQKHFLSPIYFDGTS